MIAVKNQSYATLLFAILFFGAGLSQALNSISLAVPDSDVSDSADSLSFLQARVLQSNQIPCSSYTRTTGSLKGQSFLEYQICLQARARIIIDITIGTPRYVLEISLRSTNFISQLKTDIEAWPGDYSEEKSGTDWSSSLSLDSSSFSSRRLTFTFENPSFSQTTYSILGIRVISSSEEDSSFSSEYTPSWIYPLAAVGGVIAIIIIVVFCVIRIRRRRLLERNLRQQRSRAAYRANEEVDQPQPPAQQPAQFPPQYQAQYQMQYQGQYQGQLQAPIMYQPINPNSPQQNYQFQPAIQFVQVPMQDYQYQNYQGYQLAPMQIVMPNMDEGPLSEMNIDHRFPEAPLQNFATSFPQKTCSICLEDLKTDQNCRQLYCEHIFHGECAKVWLLNQMTKQNHGFCPNCNKNMTFVVERAKS